MKRVELSFAGLKIGFCDRERAIHQIVEFAEKGTWHPIVVFGPEGCGKTSWLRQAVELLRELDFSVIYFNPMRKEFLAEVGIKSIEERVRRLLSTVSSRPSTARERIRNACIYKCLSRIYVAEKEA
jgi:ABC-type transporter Mla maintaining outer membrane lipid asymmetry ATPase subunit MlaF